MKIGVFLAEDFKDVYEVHKSLFPLNNSIEKAYQIGFQPQKKR